MTNFMSPNSIAAAQNASKVNLNEDPALLLIVLQKKWLKTKHACGTQFTFNICISESEKVLSRRALLLQIKEHFSHEIAVLSSPGLASTVVFNNDATKVSSLLKVRDDDQEELTSIENLSKIVSEVKEIKFDYSHYDIRITEEDMSKYVSPTLTDLLAAMTDNLKTTLPALLIGNIVTSALCSKPTSLQIALGNLLRDHKSIVNKLYRLCIGQQGYCGRFCDANQMCTWHSTGNEITAQIVLQEKGRVSDASRLYQLSENRPLLSQKAVLTVSANKNQVIDKICGNLASDVAFHTQHTSIHKLLVTAGDHTPTEIHKGAVDLRQDMATSHEEADNIIAQQVIMCAK